MIKVTGSPKINESLHFGYTKDKNAESLKNKLLDLSKSGFRVISVDVVFGFIVVGLSNPALDFDKYTSERKDVINAIESIVNNSEGCGE